VPLTNFRDDIGIKEIGHEGLPDVEQLVIIEVRHLCEHILERTLWRLAKKARAKYFTMLGLCAATMSGCTKFQRVDQILVEFTDEKLRHGLPPWRYQ
jgi:hypothetical protein